MINACIQFNVRVFFQRMIDIPIITLQLYMMDFFNFRFASACLRKFKCHTSTLQSYAFPCSLYLVPIFLRCRDFSAVSTMALPIFSQKFHILGMMFHFSFEVRKIFSGVLFCHVPIPCRSNQQYFS